MYQRLKNWARLLRRDVYAIYLAGRDPEVSWLAKVLAIAVAAYAFSPIDLIPDFIPVIGLLDDLIILPLGIMLIVSLIPPDIMARHRAAAEAASQRPVSQIAGIVIAVIWTIALAAIGWTLYRRYST